jgi:5-methylcytosine-specific restriction protein A
LYYTVRWRRLRLEVIAAAAHICQACGCVALALEVDHVQPHKGDVRRFWDRSNLQALCPSCHTAKTARGE